MNKALNSATRTKLRKKFRSAAQAGAIEMRVVDDISPVVDNNLPTLPPGLRETEASFREVDEAVLLQAWTRDARQGSVLYLAPRCKDRCIHPLHDRG